MQHTQLSTSSSSSEVGTSGGGRRPSPLSNVCHLFGAYLRRNWTLVFQSDVERPNRCPNPELFDLEFFERMQVLERTRSGRFHFYTTAQKEQQRFKQEERRRTADPTARTEQEEVAQSDSAWKLRVEHMLTQMTENSHAQLVMLNRLLTEVRE